MKIILSRKGFDSGYGGCASPIFPDGSMASFPIPYPGATHKMKEVFCGTHNLGDVARDLSRRRQPANQIGPNSDIHLDPDLNRIEKNRHPNWRPAFGQDAAAQTHLSNQSVGVGDIFLYFGWFRKIDKLNRNGPLFWDFVRGAPSIHIIFGWLQVGAILQIGNNPVFGAYPPWLADHPHIQDAQRFPANNTIYVSSDQLVIDGKWTGHSGGGTFNKFAPSRQLTHPAAPGRSTWQLPSWFYPFSSPTKPALTHHPEPASWTEFDTVSSTVTLQSAAIGQEFVLNGATYPEASDWLMQLFDEN